jgi:hypothetical protein
LPLRLLANEHEPLHFEDSAESMPNKSPEQVIREGTFDGSSWSTTAFRKIGVLIEDE